MPKSRIEKRQSHKKQRSVSQQLNTLVRNGSIEELENIEDSMYYDENSNNYTTMRSNGEFREETY